MIRSKKDYLFYLIADRAARYDRTQKPRLFGDEVWKYQILLRRLEYYQNCNRSPWGWAYALFLKLRFHRLGVKLGLLIPCNVFGPGLSIAHYGSIAVNSRTRVGANCRIHSNVTIGTQRGKAPVLGNNIYLGPGAVLYGDITLADGIAVGANSVVNKSFLEPNIGIAGAPAKKINDIGSKGMIKSSSDAAADE